MSLSDIKKVKDLTTCKLVPICLRSYAPYVTLRSVMPSYVLSKEKERKNECVFLNNFLVTITDNYNSVVDIAFQFKESRFFLYGLLDAA